MALRLLTELYLEFLRLKGGCTGSPASTLVKMTQYWKSHVMAQIDLLSRTWVDSGKGCESMLNV